MLDAYFDRFDICGAYLALENDWNVGGWLHERPSNARRRESTGVQLSRMRYRPARDACCSFDYLENDNQRAIYCNAARAFGLQVSADDETHAPILEFIKGNT
jgi:hypothetical protein